MNNLEVYFMCELDTGLTKLTSLDSYLTVEESDKNVSIISSRIPGMDGMFSYSALKNNSHSEFHSHIREALLFGEAKSLLRYGGFNPSRISRAGLLHFVKFLIKTDQPFYIVLREDDIKTPREEFFAGLNHIYQDGVVRDVRAINKKFIDG